MDLLTNEEYKNIYIPDSGTIFYRFIPQEKLSETIDWPNFDLSSIFTEKSRSFISPESFKRKIINDDGIQKLESYVSILFSSKIDETCRIKECIEYLKKHEVPFKKRFGFVSFDCIILLEYVNDDLEDDPDTGYIYISLEDDSIKNIGLFNKADCESAVHFGINYVQGNYSSEEILETKIIEILRDQFYFVENTKTNKYKEYEMIPPENRLKLTSISNYKNE